MFSLGLLISINSFCASCCGLRPVSLCFGSCLFAMQCPHQPWTASHAKLDGSASAWQDICCSLMLLSRCIFCTSQSISICRVLQRHSGPPVTRALQLPTPCPLITQQVPPLAGGKGTCPRPPSISGAVQRWCKVTGVNLRCPLKAGDASLSCSSWNAAESDSSHQLVERLRNAGERLCLLGKRLIFLVLPFIFSLLLREECGLSLQGVRTRPEYF